MPNQDRARRLVGNLLNCAGFTPEEDSTVLLASTYVDFVLKLVLAVGVAFVLPVFVVLLNLVGVLPGARVVASWRLVILGIVLFSALATPAADVASMFLLAVPMTMLFAAAAVIAVLHDRAVARRSSAEDHLERPEERRPEERRESCSDSLSRSSS